MVLKRVFAVFALGLGLVLAVLWILGAASPQAHAASFTVDVTDDENDGSCAPGDCSLREAIIATNNAAGADLITLGPGTHVLTIVGSGEDLAATGDLDVRGDLTIVGAGPDQTIIDASGVISDRVLEIKSQAATVVISGVTIMNGNVDGWGGEIYNYDAELLLINVVVVSNSAGLYGGGLCTSFGAVTLDGSAILSNTALQRGGGVYIAYTSAVLTHTGDSVVAFNHCAAPTCGGGGIHVSQGRAYLESGQVLSNTAYQGGGAYLSESGAELAVSGGRILTNVAQYGGGVYAHYGRLTLSGGEIRANEAGRGGGVYVSLSGAELVHTGGAIVDNKARSTDFGDEGGGIYIAQGSATLGGGQIRDNTAGWGGGVYVQGTTAVLTQSGSSSISYNAAITEGGGLFVLQATVALVGGQISRNDAGGCGGGVFINSGSLALDGGQVAGNTAENGAGVCVWNNNGRFLQSGTSLVEDNDARDTGGGLFVHFGRATLNGGQIRGNTAVAGAGIVLSGGGPVTATGMSITGNDAVRYGGGIMNVSGLLTLVNTTVSNNTAGSGSALYHPALGGGPATVMTYTTVSYNRPDQGGWALLVNTGPVVVHNTIIANATSNCNGPLSSNGYNLETDDSCGLIATGDVTTTDPLLGLLVDDGAGALIRPLRYGSPAIDAGLCVPGIDTDQRGLNRPQGPHCDIGAYEAMGRVHLPLAMRD